MSLLSALLLTAAACAIEVPAEPPEWVKVAVCGEFRGYRRPGAPNGFVITPQHLQQCVDNFARIQTDVPFDFDHQTLRAAQNGQPAPAAGWVKALEVRPGADGKPELWARCTWTSSGDTAIRRKEYRYVSPVLLFSTLDRRTGAELGCSLHSVALTNTPFLDELPPIAASLLESSPVHSLILLALSLPPATTETEAVEHVKKLAGNRAAVCGALGLAPTATDAEVTAKFASLARSAAIGDAVIAELSIAPSLDAPAAIASIKPTLGHAGYVALSTHQAVVAELNTLKAGAAFEKARSEGKITPANEAWAKAYAASNPAEFQVWCSVAPAVVAGVKPRTGPKASTAAQLTADELAVCSQLGIEPEKYLAAQEA